MIDELLYQEKLEHLLRDSFANYVVQTALEYCNPEQRLIVPLVNKLIECIKPILPSIKSTPYGKRIQSKII